MSTVPWIVMSTLSPGSSVPSAQLSVLPEKEQAPAGSEDTKESRPGSGSVSTTFSAAMSPWFVTVRK